MVMKYAKFGSISSFIKSRDRFTEEEIRTIMAQVILAVDLMHRNGIIHRDIKPDNILMVDKNELNIQISDLGLACRINDLQQINGMCGTPGYVAPEVLKR